MNTFLYKKIILILLLVLIIILSANISSSKENFFDTVTTSTHGPDTVTTSSSPETTPVSGPCVEECNDLTSNTGKCICHKCCNAPENTCDKYTESLMKLHTFGQGFDCDKFIFL